MQMNESDMVWAMAEAGGSFEPSDAKRKSDYERGLAAGRAEQRAADQAEISRLEAILAKHKIKF